MSKGRLIFPKSVLLACKDSVEFVYNNVSKYIRVKGMEEDYQNNSYIFHYDLNKHVKDSLIVVLDINKIYYSNKGVLNDNSN